MTPFDFVNNFGKGKKLYTEETKKAYVPFLINKALSYTVSTIFYADEMNFYPGLSHRMQADFLNISIKSSGRSFVPWTKPDATEDVLLISEYYECNLPKARRYLAIMSEEDIQTIRDKMKKGGTEGGNQG